MTAGLLVCAEVRPRLEPFVDGDLAELEASAVRDHLARCAACRAQHDEASSLGPRLAALRSPAPPRDLVRSVMRRVAPRSRPFAVWGLLGPEAVVVLVAAWYVSGVGGLISVGRRALSEAAASIGWGAGQGDLPQPGAQDPFLLLLAVLLAALTLWHLSLLARSPRRPA